ncbi:MAG: hypothetical protein ACJ749_17620 [Flavisolibacter sp.]
MVGISVNTLKTARNRLQQAGLIQFKPGGKGSRDKCIYLIVPASQLVDKVSNSDTLSEKLLTPYLIPGLEKTDDISKQKQNQTKQKEVVPGFPAPPKKNSGKNNDKEKEREPFWDLLVKTWFDFNYEKFKDKPSFDGPDPRYLKKIIEKLKKRAAAKKIVWSEITGPERLRTFLSAAYGDDWLCKHFLLKNLNEQFDTIIMQQKKANGERKAPKVNGHVVAKSFEQELEYMAGRYSEGALDERLVTKDLYDKMVSRSILPMNSLKHFPGETIEAKMKQAVLNYFEQQKPKVAYAT